MSLYVKLYSYLKQLNNVLICQFLYNVVICNSFIVFVKISPQYVGNQILYSNGNFGAK